MDSLGSIMELWISWQHYISIIINIYLKEAASDKLLQRLLEKHPTIRIGLWAMVGNPWNGGKVEVG